MGSYYIDPQRGLFYLDDEDDTSYLNPSAHRMGSNPYQQNGPQFGQHYFPSRRRREGLLKKIWRWFQEKIVQFVPQLWHCCGKVGEYGRGFSAVWRLLFN